MKTIYTFAVLLMAALFVTAGCKSDSHKIVASQTGISYASIPGSDSLTFIDYTVDDDYTISLPQRFRSTPGLPERFSLEFSGEGETEFVCVEADTKTLFENRRKEAGNLNKYPFTLKGFSQVMMDAQVGKPGFRLISSQDTVVNGMPSRLEQYDFTTNGLSFRNTVVSVEATNGKLYRIQLTRAPDDAHTWVVATYNSFVPLPK